MRRRAAWSGTPGRPAAPGAFFVAASAAAVLLAACGKKGPPLPPLLRVPVAPTALAAARQGSRVNIQFVIPNANTDGSKPADVIRVDVYAVDSAEAVTDEEIVRRGDKIGTVAVNPPPDPDEDPDAPRPARTAPLAEEALDQGATAHIVDEVAARRAGSGATEGATEGPADHEPGAIRSYAAVGVNRRGRPGPASARAAVPLAAAPEPPAAPRVTYTERAITVEWDAPAGMLPVHVYDAAGVRLTDKPVADTRFSDEHVEWDAERCFALRSVEIIGGLAVESDASAPTCVTLKDTFPPSAPTGITAVASEGSISLIWNANQEKDLAGYRVLRATSPGAPLAPLTAEPIPETTFRDMVPAGTRATYAIQAVDRAGNASPPSERTEETAR